MALATRPKPKVQHKKRVAQHHRQSKTYLKAYWPYLPMLAIVAVGVVVSSHWPTGLVTVNPQATTRVEAISGSQNEWALLVIILMSGIAAAILIATHWFRVVRVLSKGEQFIVKHPWLDLALVVICTVGVVLTRSNS